MNGFDVGKLSKAMKRKMSDENVSGYQAAEQIGIKSSTFYRILNFKGSAEPDNLLPICAWLGVPFEHFTSGDPTRVIYYETGETLDRIEALISADPNLSGADKVKLFEIFRAEYQIITNLGKQ